MSRYIDADMLEKDGWNMQRIRQASSTEMVYETKKPTDFPSADVAEVRHGHWKGLNRNKYNDDEATCSVCGVTFSSGYSDPSWWDYCPNCGSRMDLESEDE